MRYIELETPIDEMDESDLRETFSQVMDTHEDNVEEYENLQERAEKVDEFSERVDELEDEKKIAVEYFSGKASEVTNISEEILQTRFSINELVEMACRADEAAQFSEEEVSDDGGGEVEDDEGTIFADKEQKSPNFSEAVDGRKEAAKKRMSNLSGISL